MAEPSSSECEGRSASDFCQLPAKFGYPDLRAHGKTRALVSRRNEQFREQLGTMRTVVDTLQFRG